MKEKTKHIDILVKNKLDHLEMTPPDHVWSNIEKSLDAKPKKISLITYIKYSGVAAAIVLFLVSGIIYFSKDIDSISNRVNNSLAVESIEISNNLNLSFPVSNLSLLDPGFRSTSMKHSYAFRAQSQSHSLTASSMIINYKLKSKSTHKSILTDNRLLPSNKEFDWEEYRIQELDFEQINTQNKWNLGFAYSPNIKSSFESNSNVYTKNEALPEQNKEFLMLSNNPTNESSSESINTKDIVSTTSFGLNLSYTISKKVKLVSGLSYLQYQNKVNNLVIWGANTAELKEMFFNTNVGMVRVENSAPMLENSKVVESNVSYGQKYYGHQIEVPIIQRFEFIEVPLLINYELINNKFSVDVVTGFNTDILISNKAYLNNSESSNIGETENISEILLKSVFGISFNYPLLKNVHLCITPSYKYQINKFNTNRFGAERLNFFDVSTALSIRF